MGIADSPASSALARFNAMSATEAEPVLLACCSSRAWAASLLAQRPFDRAAELFDANERVVAALDDDDLAQALAGHPRIGERAAAGHNPGRSRLEQAGMDDAAVATRAAMAELNVAYEQRFGYVYLVCASGLSADELLDRLRSRLANDPVTERRVMRSELAKINTLRLAAMLSEDG